MDRRYTQRVRPKHLREHRIGPVADPGPFPASDRLCRRSNKFLVPFLEKASLEELDSPLIDRWADLLASCSEDPPSAHPRFVQILSELTGKDAILLHSIALNAVDRVEPEELTLLFWVRYFDPVEIQRKIMLWLREKDNTPEGGYDYLQTMFDKPGVSLIDITLSERNTDQFWSFDLSLPDAPPAASNQAASHLDVLRSLHLISKHHLQFTNDQFEIDVYYVCMTQLGSEFLTKCDCEVRQKFV